MNHTVEYLDLTDDTVRTGQFERIRVPLLSSGNWGGNGLVR